MFTCICEGVCVLLIDLCYILCVNAGIFILNMMDHKWSAYHDISSTLVFKTLATLFKLFLYFHCQSFIYLKILRLCE